MQRDPLLRMTMRLPRYSSTFATLIALLFFPRHRADRSFGDDAAAAAGDDFGPRLFPFPLDRALRPFLPILAPIAERIAVPGRLRRKLRQAELLPDRLGTIPEVAGGK